MPSRDWKEIVSEGEAERFERHATLLRDWQQANAKTDKKGRVSRALHAKPQAGVRAEFTVLSDLPEHARVAIFAAPATYKAFVRFSKGAPVRQRDSSPDVRGAAIKVLGVGGKKLIVGMEDARTQDFLMIRTPSTPFRDPDEFVAAVYAARSPALLLPRFFGALGLRAGLRILPRIIKSLGAPTPSVATARYFSAVPIRFGAYAVKFGIIPKVTESAGGKTSDNLGKELAERLRKGPVEYDFAVQFFVDETKTPIEDASVEWQESESPFVTVARLTIPQQDLASPEGLELAERIETLSFDPWHAAEELRPLGSMMRARNPAYRESTKGRSAAPEPNDA
jgi:hypothetical protein